jgi:hypothetical protein
MTARWNATRDASDLRSQAADEPPADCQWCDPPAMPIYSGRLCRRHWDEAHDFWDADE